MKVDWIQWNLNFLSFRRLESFLELQVYLRRLHRRLCHWCEEQSFLENRIHLKTSDSAKQKQQKMSSLLGASENLKNLNKLSKSDLLRIDDQLFSRDFVFVCRSSKRRSWCWHWFSFCRRRAWSDLGFVSISVHTLLRSFYTNSSSFFDIVKYKTEKIGFDSYCHIYVWATERLSIKGCKKLFVFQTSGLKNSLDQFLIDLINVHNSFRFLIK